MKITDLKIGQFAKREWFSKKRNSSLCIKKMSATKFYYYENGQWSSTVRNNSSAFKYDDFELCDCNGKLIEEFTYPLFMENIFDKSTAGRVVKFVSLSEGNVVIQGNSVTLPGNELADWIDHTDSEHWKPYDFSKAPEIDDLDYWDARFNAGLQVYFSFNSNNNDKLYKLFDAPSIAFYKDIKFHISDESKPKFTYPMYFECINNPLNKGMIVKFKELNKGLLVKEAKNGICKITIISREWSKHTDKETWKQVNFDEKLNKIIPTQDDIDELISDLKSIIEDSDNRFSPSEYGAGTQLKESGYDQCRDLIDELMEKYYITETPDIGNEEDFIYFNDLFDVVEYIKGLLYKDYDKQDDYASNQNIAYIQIEKTKSRLNDDALDAFSYAKHVWNYLQQDTGATEVANNLNQSKEFTMTKELKQTILELIAESKQLKVKKPKTPKIVCNVDGTLMEFADEAALKSFMWSSRVESVIRYDLAGKVTVPFELSVEAPKTKASK